ncbi:MAG: 3-deoxy-manno-octulosonate cytidylyltransferase [Smithellaceae bacterium]|nr:3-deoxy-manno-octulosonate cytidylyltransferase [Smithellaceae bacterium]
MKIIAIIPARYQSTRFEGKPLADLAGKPVIQHVFERASRSAAVSMAVVATDDERIRAAVEDFGGRVIMTAPCHRSGTDRIAEAAEILGLAADDIVVNIQGDQPLFESCQIDEVIAPLKTDPSLEMTTLIYRIRIPEEITHPNAVKVVFDRDNFALYFSRATIPYVRDRAMNTPYYKHHGIYAYRRSFLSTFAALPEGTMEKLEALEQLRAMEYGHRIKVVETDFDSLEIDTRDDLKRAKDILMANINDRK